MQLARVFVLVLVQNSTKATEAYFALANTLDHLTGHQLYTPTDRHIQLTAVAPFGPLPVNMFPMSKTLKI